MIKYFTEAEENSIPDIDITVQVGPEEDEEMVSVNPQEANPESEVNPVDEAKKNPNTIVVAQKSCSEGCCGKREGCDSEECDDEDDDDDEGRCGKGEGCCGKREGCCEFYVDAADVAKYADLTEKTMLEALNDIIACNEESGIRADNLVVVVDESTACYVRNLEKNGAACVTYMNEAGVEDINIDVQVGPEKDERVVSADPQEANPVDAVKRQYDTVVVAKKGDDFFLDVEDAQKCAELNCESVISTLNGVIACNEEYDMNTENLFVMVHENTSKEILATLEAAGVLLEVSFSFLPKLSREPDMKKYADDLKEAEKLCKDNGIDSKAGALKACRIATRILSIYHKVSSVLCFPAILTIIGIVPYLMVRALDWLAANAEVSAAKAEGAKVIKAIDEAIAKEENEDVKTKLRAARDKVEESMKKVQSEFD